MEDGGEGGVAVKGRAIIDTRPPFGSVKEAVTLFGEKVLAGQVYGPMLKNVMMETKPNGGGGSTMGAMKSELEETKRRLERSREEAKMMANSIKSLRQELEKTRKEVQHLKSKNFDNRYYYNEPMIINPEIEEIKFVENNSSPIIDYENNGDEFEFQHHQVPTLKKFVSFASPPSLVREIDTQQEIKGGLGRAPSFRKEGKKKPLSWLFNKKKTNT